MKDFLVNARTIEIKITTDKNIALTLGGRYCNMTTFSHPLPTVKMTEDEVVEHISNHYRGFIFGTLVSPKDSIAYKHTPYTVAPSKHLDKLNNIFDTKLVELILSVDKFDSQEFSHVFETALGEVEVIVIIRGHVSVERRDLEDELKNSYLDYAMSVIVGRALPDVRDGLKPVHRRSLFAMDVLGNGAGKPYKKSARVVGDVIGKYHPHGDCQYFDTLFLCLDGTRRKIGEIFESGDETVEVLSYDETTDSYVPAVAHSFRIGQYANRTYKIMLSDGSTMEATNNHPFYVEGMGWVKTEDLVAGQMLKGGAINDGGKYNILKRPRMEGTELYHLTCKDEVPDGSVRHHVDHNPKNDRPSNLQVLTRGEHADVHKDYNVGLDNGRKTMGSTPEWVEARRKKNSELMRAYNRTLPLIKACQHINHLMDNGIEVNEETYGDKENIVIYNLTRLSTIKESYGMDLPELIKMAEMGYKIDTEAAKGHTSHLNHAIKQQAVSWLRVGETRAYAVAVSIMSKMVLGGVELTWDNYQTCLHQHTLNHGRVGVVSIKQLQRLSGINDIYEMLAVLSNRGNGVFITSIVIEDHAEPVPMYDFTVDKYENAVIVMPSDNDWSTFVVTHNSAVYDTIVRLAQSFSMRYPLVDGQGNFGSVDGDSAAAMRYTEIRMNKITEMLMKDMECETVDYVPNYDGTEMIPSVFPTRIPTLLVNGSSGIAVGMATNIPPHNLSEVIAGCHAYIEDKEITNEGLMEYITGPDFPTGAIINGKQGIVDAYKTGRGKIYMRAVAHIETSKTNRESIVVTEIPYQVNKARLIEKMAELVKDRKLEGISHLRDESDKDGMRIVIDIKRDAIAEVVLNNLYTLTQMQHTFGINMVALQDGQPKLFDLKGLIKAFVNHRCEVVTRRTIFNLRKAKERMNILEGYILCRSHLDEIIKIIKGSPNKRVAMDTILEKQWFVRDELSVLLSRTHANINEDGDNVSFNEEQVQAILELRLYQLTNMEKSKVLNELADYVTLVIEYEELLGDSEVLMEKISEELDDIYTEFGDERKTTIMASFQELQSEDLIEDEHVVLTLSDAGYVKYQPVSEYNEQRRGGVGKASSNMKQEDFMTTLIVCKTHDTVLCFSSTGRMYWSKVYQLPAASRGSRGKPIVNILPVEENEVITAILPVRSYDDNHFVFMATRMGVVKKVAMSAFSRPRQSGIIAINLADNDELIGCGITDGTKDIMLFSDNGKVVRFPEEQVRAMGRTATGVRGMRLKETGNVVSLVIPKEGDTILTATARGYGKNTELSEYPVKGRGTQGVVSIKVTSRNGLVIGAVAARYEESILLIANTGMMIRTPVAEMPTIGRNTQGVIIMRVKDKDDETRLVGISRVVEDASAVIVEETSDVEETEE